MIEKLYQKAELAAHIIYQIAHSQLNFFKEIKESIINHDKKAIYSKLPTLR